MRGVCTVDSEAFAGLIVPDLVPLFEVIEKMGWLVGDEGDVSIRFEALTQAELAVPDSPFSQRRLAGGQPELVISCERPAKRGRTFWEIPTGWDTEVRSFLVGAAGRRPPLGEPPTTESPPPGYIFVSYRREDSEADSNALYQSLERSFGAARIFKDVDNVPLGVNWKQAVIEAVESSSVMLLVMGPEWKLTRPIAVELETAFAHGVPVIPLLVRGSKIEDLCTDLQPPLDVLNDLNAAELSHSSWSRDLSPVLQTVGLYVELGESQLPKDRQDR